MPRACRRAGAFVGLAAATGILAGCATTTDYRGGGDRELQQLKLQVQALLDKEEIRQQISAYSRAMDRRDMELARTVFHRDSIVDFGDFFRGNGWDFVEATPDYQKTTLIAASHAMSNVSIWLLDQGRARSEAYGDATLRSRLPDGNVQDRRVLARYVDEWVKSDARWQIMNRKLLVELEQVFPPHAPTADAGESMGRRDREDPSYFPGDAR